MLLDRESLSWLIVRNTGRTLKAGGVARHPALTVESEHPPVMNGLTFQWFPHQ